MSTSWPNKVVLPWCPTAGGEATKERDPVSISCEPVVPVRRANQPMFMSARDAIPATFTSAIGAQPISDYIGLGPGTPRTGVVQSLLDVARLLLSPESRAILKKMGASLATVMPGVRTQEEALRKLQHASFDTSDLGADLLANGVPCIHGWGQTHPLPTDVIGIRLPPGSYGASFRAMASTLWRAANDASFRRRNNGYVHSRRWWTPVVHVLRAARGEFLRMAVPINADHTLDVLLTEPEMTPPALAGDCRWHSASGWNNLYLGPLAVHHPKSAFESYSPNFSRAIERATEVSTGRTYRYRTWGPVLGRLV